MPENEQQDQFLENLADFLFEKFREYLASPPDCFDFPDFLVDLLLFADIDPLKVFTKEQFNATLEGLSQYGRE